MLIDYILWGIVVLSVVALIALISRKFSVLRTIDVGSIPAERQGAVKTDIIEERLKRRFGRIFGAIVGVIRPLGVRIGGWTKKGYGKLRELEKQYEQQARTPTNGQSNGEVQVKLTKVLAESEELTKQDEYREAEKRLIEAITLDPKNCDAFTKLGTVYLELKEYEQARETFEYLVQLNERDDCAYFELGEVHKALGNYPEAIRYYTQASRYAANNPKYLDALVDIAVLTGDRALAWENYDKLRSVNPENQKLEELKEQIEALEQSNTPT